MADEKTEQALDACACACGRTTAYYYGVQAAANALMDMGQTGIAIDMATKMGGAAREAINISVFLRASLDPDVYAAVWIRMNGDGLAYP